MIEIGLTADYTGTSPIELTARTTWLFSDFFCSS